jgi:hypothetical protein
MKNIGDTICFATSYNRKRKNDGDEFMREMAKFQKEMTTEVSTIRCIALRDPTEYEVFPLKNQICKKLKEFKKLNDNLVFFMHGWWRGLIGADYNIWTSHLLARAIQDFMKPAPTIILYACGCGGGKSKWKNIHEYRLGSRWDMRGEFGFAMRLANDLSELGVHDYRIFAHIGKGHVTKRPYCVWIIEDNGFIKRRIIVPYQSWASFNRKGRRQWIRWVNYIQKTKTGRFEAPFLTKKKLAEIIGE